MWLSDISVRRPLVAVVLSALLTVVRSGRLQQVDGAGDARCADPVGHHHHHL